MAEKVIQWSESLFTLHSELDEAIEHLERTMNQIQDGLGTDNVIMALSAKETDRWRPKVLPTYKANRKKTRKPIVYNALREYVHEIYDTYERPELEGDDVLGILATHPTLIKSDEKIIVSIDKDLKTIPGLLLNYDSAREDDHYVPKVITEFEADRFFMLQTLMGDATDGYKGCPGIGPKSAEKVLAGATTLKEMWERVVATYEKAGLSVDVALQNARVARICRHTDYDFKKKKVKLWNPPN